MSRLSISTCRILMGNFYSYQNLHVRKEVLKDTLRSSKEAVKFFSEEIYDDIQKEEKEDFPNKKLIKKYKKAVYELNNLANE